MFTGIVQGTGVVRDRQRDFLLVEPARAQRGVRIGESISVDGVCLTVERAGPRRMRFHLLPETVRVTTLGSLKAGTRVNLERAVRAGDRLGGHLLLGHVDGRGTVIGRRRSGRAVTMEIRVPPALAPLLVPKGPIAVDGVSLTLGNSAHKIRGSVVSVHLIAQTLSATTLGGKEPGTEVNLEVDPVAKYLWGML